MALTIAVDKRRRVGLPGANIVTGTVTFDSSYATGGEALSPADLGFREEIFALVVDSAPLVCRYDAANDKLQAYNIQITITGGQAGTVAIGIASDANGAALSKTTATNRTGITGAALTEVPNGTDLSGYGALRFLAIGI